MARRSLILILYAGGLATLLIVALHLALGSASIPGAGAVNATIDSEDRFYATIFGGYGLALLHCARDVEGRASLIRFLAGLFFAGAFARLASWLLVGPPHPFFIAMLILELALPVLIWALQAAMGRRAVVSAAPARRSDRRG